MTSFHGRDFCSYRGIRYAEPPVGELRFRAPIPAGAWQGELNATEDVSGCPQGYDPYYSGNEDCLFLNVYTPQSDTTLSLPVMVFIHGGGYTSGDNSAAQYGPHYFLDKDIVLVAINYRLGVLGFLSTGDDASPGNYGLKDQLEALRWVQKNIAVFGGDANKVTIFGESAGGFSVHYHVLSPLSKGLFHAAIAESGSALMPMYFQNEGMLSKAQRLATAVGCPTDSSEELIKCLRTLDVQSIMVNQPSDCNPPPGAFSFFFCLYDVFWRPVSEVRTAANPEPFLTANPKDIITSGDFNRVPFVLGTNSEEGSMFLLPFISTLTGIDYFNNNTEYISQVTFFLNESVSADLISDTWNKVVEFYLGSDRVVTTTNVHNIINAATDRFMQHNVQKSVELHLQAGHDTVYLYNLAYRGKFSVVSKTRYGNTRYDLGVVHADDLEFILSSSFLVDRWEPGHPDLETVEALITLWTHVAQYGNPTPPLGSLPPQGVVWPTAGADGDVISYYVLDNAPPPAEPIYGVRPLHISVVPDKFKDRMDFWDSLPLKENQ
jgi:carboxylesterase type B